MGIKRWVSLGFMFVGFGMAAFFGQTIQHKVGGLWDLAMPGYTLGVIFASFGAAGQGLVALREAIESLSARVAELERAEQAGGK